MSLFLGAGGPVGGWLEEGLRLLVGRAVAVAPLALLLVGLGLILDHPLLGARPLRLGVLIGSAAVVVALAGGVFGLGGSERTAWFEDVGGRGGHIGEAGYWITSSTVGGFGTALLIVVALIAAAVLISGASLGLAVRRGGEGAAVASRSVGRGVALASQGALKGGQRIRERLDAIEPPTLISSRRRARPVESRPLVDGADAYADIFDGPSALPPSPALVGEAPADEDDVLPRPASPLTAAAVVANEPVAPPERAAEQLELADEAPELEPVFTPTPAPSRMPEPRGARGTPYRRPPLSLLRRSSGPTSLPEDLVRRTSRQLEEALGHFGIEATVTDTVGGPRVTRYELQLAPGTKVGRITALRDDLAYALASREELRIIAPIPGKQAVGVEVPNPEASLVTLGDITREFPPHAGPLMAWLGLDLGGKPVYIDLAKMPHLLIAGSTGTGKSVCLNSLLASLLLRSTPDELRMILIDPKKVELNHYESIPHLLTPVVTNMKDAAAVLSNIVREMETRYELMGMARARNLRDWNEIRVAGGEKPIPTVLVVIDELADLMMVSPAEVEDSIIRLAQKSRAVGIHLVLATQRPSADVITGMIKANVPSRIAFAVSSQVDSRVVLDAGGAESLLGQGDMLFRPVGTSRLQRLQGAYIGEDEILAITDHWRAQGKPEMRRELMERAEPEDDPVETEVDDMLERAIEMVVEQGTASVSLLQRRLGVGYARAGRLVDSMERMGVVSGHEGSKPRTVLVGPGDLDRLLRRTPAPEPEPAEEEAPAPG
ncbi:DNA translocase FtsK [Miltoncostaea marina]|uniref:DNA translocase FtsK n=1 Tax=Miltoncostaea marina TaxID=2843215 RepID=UPI001C3D6E6C|nr:DNA translocase FtsK [Miltoncostaea marina]